MLNWIMNKLGYLQISKINGFRDLNKEPLTEDELSFMLAELLLDVNDDFTSETEEKIFTQVRGVDGLVSYLRDAANKDMRRYFGATTKEEQLIIRGSYARTNYLRARISGEKKTKIDGIRYG